MPQKYFLFHISRRSQEYCTYAWQVLNLTGFASHGTVIAIAVNRLFGLFRVTRLNMKALMTPTKTLGLCVMIWILVSAIVIPTTFYKGTEVYVFYISIAIATVLVIGSYIFLGLLFRCESDKLQGGLHNERQNVAKIPKNLIAFTVAYITFTVLPTIGLSPMSSQHSSLGIGLLIITKEEGVDLFSVLLCHSW